MASIEDRRESGRARPWRVVYRDPAGEKRSRSFARKTDAERFRSTVEADLVRGQWRDPRLGATTVEVWARQWLATTADQRASTRVRTVGIVEGYVVPRWGAHPLAAVEHLDIRRWTAELTLGGLAPRSVRKVVHVLSSILGAAVDARLIGVNPCDRVPLPRAEDHAQRFLEPSDVLALAEAFDPRYRAFVLVAGFAGLRLGELAGLRRSRVDLLRGRVEVVEAAVEAGGAVRFGPPKSRAGRRTVSIAAPVRIALDDHLAGHVAPTAGALVFPAPGGGVLRASSWRQRFWMPALRASGLEPLRVHDLRHSAISFWIAAGVDPKQVSTWAGHSSVSFTLDRYGHLYADADERSRGRLDALLATSTAPRDGEVRVLRG